MRKLNITLSVAPAAGGVDLPDAGTSPVAWITAAFADGDLIGPDESSTTNDDAGTSTTAWTAV